MSENEMSIKELYELLQKSQEEQTKKLTNEIHKTKEEYNKKINKIEKDIQELQDNYLDLERRRRKNNIIIFGLKVNENNILEETIQALNNKLDINLEERYVNDIFEIEKRENKKGILVEFISYLTKKYIFKNTHKLRDTRFSIVNDLCPEDQRRKRILVKHLKAARSKNQKARIRGWRLEIEGRSYSLEELENTGINYKSDNNSSEEEVEDKEEPTIEKSEISEKRKKGPTNNIKEKESRKHKETRFNLNTRAAVKK